MAGQSQQPQQTKRRRSAIVIMGSLVGLVKPLVPIMVLAVLFGVVGYLCAIFLTIVAGYELVAGLSQLAPQLPALGDAGPIGQLPAQTVFAILVCLGVARGVLHYLEQYCNHYIAFKLLAAIRHRVFAALRRLCPAKLEGRDKGDLISLITSDIELLEVFYAHTISPILIAIVVSLVMVAFLATQAWQAALLALAGYLTIGLVVPLLVGRAGAQPGLAFRNAFGDLNAYALTSLRGIDETIQYGDGQAHLAELARRSADMAGKQKALNRLEASQRSFSNLIVLAFSFAMLFMMVGLHSQGAASFAQALIATVAMMGSFGPVLALSNLANNLNQTLACGDRVLDLLEERPQVDEAEGGEEIGFEGAALERVSFGYSGQTILDDYSLTIEKGQVIGIHGPSGSGKSTLLKLLMRFWDPDRGSVSMSGRDLRGVNTASLRQAESYVTQETALFHDSIAANIAIARPDATREEIVEAAKKASIHDFIMTLPQGYDTEVGELGDTLSGGERQRIGIARAFLHDAPLLLLDEPTSNLDSLNEGIILKSLASQLGRRTVVLVSHRASTMSMADAVFEMKPGRSS